MVMNASAVPTRRVMGRSTSAALMLSVLGLVAAIGDLWTDLLSGTSVGQALLDTAYPASIVAAGAVVALARPENRIGWAMLIAGTAAGAGDALVSLGVHGIVEDPGSVAGATAWAVLGSVVRGIGWFGITLAVPMWFPDGHTLPGRWRHLEKVLVAVLVLDVIGQGLAEQAQLLHMGSWRNPLSSPVGAALADPASLLMMLLAGGGLVFAVAQLVVRFRRATPSIRRQIGLFAVAAAVPICASPLGVFGIAGGWIFQATAIPLPLAVGYAILSRGLYDVSTAANRTLVWIAMSATIFGAFAVIVGVAGALVPHGHQWMPWLAAALVAAAALPLRDRLQKLVNRVTYGQWEDPQVILGRLGQRLAGSADVPGLLDELTGELTQSLGLAEVAITDSAGSVLAGSAEPGEESLPLVVYGRPVGSLRFRVPADLRPGHRDLLGDLASHLGAVIYAGGVTADLQRAREHLVLAREEERRRLRRDLHDGLGPALAGHLLQIEVLAARASRTDLRAQLEELAADIRATVGDIRRVVEGLRPPALDEMGLLPAIDQATHRMLVATGIRADIRGVGIGLLPAAVEVAAYRIVTEAANNCARHSGAATFRVLLSRTAEGLVLEIADDGRGFVVPPGRGHGLDTMRERAEELGGSLDIDGRRGTAISATIPLPPSAPARTPDGRGQLAPVLP